MQLKGWLRREEQPMIYGHFEIMQYAFHSNPVRWFWCVHKLTHLVYSIGYIEPSKGQVLQTSHNASIHGNIIKLGESSLDNFRDVAMGEVTNLACNILLLVRRSLIYFLWDSSRLLSNCVISNPRKYERGPRSLRGKAKLKYRMKVSMAIAFEVVIMKSSTYTNKYIWISPRLRTNSEASEWEATKP